MRRSNSMLLVLLICICVSPSLQSDVATNTKNVPTFKVLAHDKIKVSFQQSFQIDKEEQKIIKIALEDKDYISIPNNEFTAAETLDIETLEVTANLDACVSQVFSGAITFQTNSGIPQTNRSSQVNYTPYWAGLKNVINQSMCLNKDNNIVVKVAKIENNPLMNCLFGIEICEDEKEIVQDDQYVNPPRSGCTTINITTTNTDGELTLGAAENKSMTIRMVPANREEGSEEAQFLIYKGEGLQDKKSCYPATKEVTIAALAPIIGGGAGVVALAVLTTSLACIYCKKRRNHLNVPTVDVNRSYGYTEEDYESIQPSSQLAITAKNSRKNPNPICYLCISNFEEDQNEDYGVYYSMGQRVEIESEVRDNNDAYEATEEQEDESEV